MAQASLKSLSDEALIARVDAVILNIRRQTAELLVLIIEVEDRRIHLREGFPSMFEYCVRRLALSEGETYRRLAAAAILRRIPKLLPYIERNEVRLSRIVQLGPHLTPENLEEVVAATRGMSNFRVQELLVQRSPKGVVPDRLRKLPTMDTQGSVTPAARPVIEPRAEDRYRLQVTVTRETRDMIERARDRLSHVIPRGDLSALVEAAFRALDEKLERKRFGRASRAEPNAAPVEENPQENVLPTEPPAQKKEKNKEKKKGKKKGKKKSTNGPSAAVRRRIFERDGEQCTYVSEDGRRCSSRRLLEVDHIVPRAQGGTDDEENLRLRCGPHNGLHAEESYGKEHVRACIEARRREAAAKKKNKNEKKKEKKRARGDQSASATSEPSSAQQRKPVE